jgi:hypothetical protein
MSGIAAAKKRRAGITVSAPEPPRLPNGGIAVQQQQSNPQQGLTLPQVIALLDSRITKLEKSVSVPEQLYNQSNNNDDNKQELLPSNISEILDNFQEKFIILAGEINSLKDTVLKLQSYTMDVNKVLLEERIQVLSDIGENERYVLESNNSVNSDNENIMLDNETNVEVESLNTDYITKITNIESVKEYSLN